MKITKSAIIMIVLIVWAVFSIGYIGWNSWNNFKLSQMRVAANQGYQQAVIDVAAEANKCANTGVPLNVGTDKDGKQVTVTIVGVSCLQQAQNNTPAATTPTTPTAPKK
jgi:predicted negative regulator of RcsB-dependent stress response